MANEKLTKAEIIENIKIKHFEIKHFGLFSLRISIPSFIIRKKKTGGIIRMRRTRFVLLISIVVVLVSSLILVGCKNDPEPQIEPGENDLAVSFCIGLAKGLASVAGSEVGELALGNILSVFGFPDPEAKLSEKLDVIQDKLNSISSDLNVIENQIDSLRNYMLSVEKTVLAEIDRSEFDTRMSVLNQYFSQIDTLYDKFIRIATSDDYAEAKALADQLIADIEGKDLPSMLSDLSLEYYGGGSGSQRSLIDIFTEYLSKSTTWTFQMVYDLDSFIEYCETEMFRIGSLYLEYCSYKQAQNADDEGQFKAWGSNAETAKSNLIDRMTEIDYLKLDINYYAFNYGSVYHFANLAYGFDFYLDTNPTYMIDYMTWGEWMDYHYISTVSIDQFQKMDALRKALAVDADLLSFIERETGVNLGKVFVAGCIPNDGSSPIISLKTVTQNDQEWGLTQDRFFKTWVADKPLLDIEAK